MRRLRAERKKGVAWEKLSRGGFFVGDDDFDWFLRRRPCGGRVAAIAVEAVAITAHNVLQIERHMAQFTATLAAVRARRLVGWLTGFLRIRLVGHGVSPRHGAALILSRYGWKRGSCGAGAAAGVARNL